MARSKPRPALEAPNPYGNPARLRRVFLVAAAIYPLWHLATPDDAVDPWWAWWAVAGSFAVVSAASHVLPVVERHLPSFLHGCAALCSLQLYLLASLNDMHPFYAVGSVMSVFSTGVSIRARPTLVAFGLFILTLSVVLFLVEPDGRKLAYWGGALTVLGAAYYRLDAQLTAAELTRQHQERLEQRVRERTRELSEANRRLRREMDERASLEEKLRLSQKLEALGRLAGGVAHEFNNLLTRIRLYADLALENVPPGNPAQEELAEIHKAGRQAASMTQQLLTFSRRGRTHTEVLDLNDVVHQSSSMLRHLIGEDVTLREVPGGGGALWLEADRGQLEQILVNLALNARDAMPEGGRFSIETERIGAEELGERDLPDPPSGPGYAGLVVSDTGIGMDAESRVRAFDPFYTGKPVDQGTGLGLSIVYGIVTQAGGQIRLLSEPDKGARFEIYWPLTSERPGQLEAAPLQLPVGGSERILLVEDETQLRVALRRLLESCGYAVLEAADGRAALDLAEDFPGRIDLLLSDVVMPRMSGIELAERLAERRPGTRRLLISGHLDHPAVRSRKLPPGLELLAKPFEPDDLVRAIREILERPAGSAAPPPGSSKLPPSSDSAS